MSDELEKLAERARAEKAKDAASTDAARRAAQTSASDELSREDKKRRDDAIAPTGFAWSMRMFGLGFIGLSLLAWFLASLLEEDMRGSWPVLGIITAVWALLTALLWLDSRTWRSRLPFALEGFDQIDGRDGTGSDRIPLIDFEVEVVMTGDASGAAEHVRTALTLLCTAANRAMSKEDDLKGTRVQRWDLRQGLVASGEGVRALYVTRVFEKWFRRDLRVVARAFPIQKVVFRAKYNGNSYWAPSTD